jgi:shikimate dehydrogenase
LKLALIGDPVEHSRSPRLHGRFLEEAGIEGTYTAIRVARGEGAAAVRRLRDEGYTGINVTTPLKEEVLAACEKLDEDARMAEAVNTIFFGARVLGSNTDGIGARSALETIMGQPVALERVGILGTGATARAILAQLHETDAYTYVWGRDHDKVLALCDRFEAQQWPESPPEIVISALPPSSELPKHILEHVRKADLVMDTNYGERSNIGLLLHREVVTGDQMLEAQARASFEFWLAHARHELEEIL